MNLPPLHIPELLRRHGLRPDKRLGQNFLIDPVALQRVVSAAGIEADQLVLEVGPGLGSLTRLLAQSARQVVAVELDSGLIPALREVLAPFDNVSIVQGDILAFPPGELIQEEAQNTKRDYLVVANIPYYITSALIRHLLEASLPPSRMVLTVQREVADRIGASPGEMSLLALSVQVYGHPQIVAQIPAGAFYPPPKIDSAIVRVDRYPAPLIPTPLLPSFFTLAKAGFSQKRKTLRNALAGGMQWTAHEAGDILQTAGIDPMRRAETLSLDEWRHLTESVAR